ncbi:MAG TPA: carbohydrate-binding domain-containing protein [Polyangiaceae bacterium]|nr:carbohydrate-binding domain-containing protein [Polyangiaceae bacterium]
MTVVRFSRSRAHLLGFVRKFGPVCLAGVVACSSSGKSGSGSADSAAGAGGLAAQAGNTSNAGSTSAGSTATASGAGGTNGGTNNGGANSGGTNNGGATASSGATGMTTTVVDSPTGEAFDPTTGVLDVDYAGYLSKHDIVYNKENTNPLYGLRVGSGRLGAMAWSDSGNLTMQVSNVDDSPQNAFSAGLIHFATTPALDDGTTNFQQRLALYDGDLVTTYASDRKVTILGDPGSEVMGIHVEDARTGLSSVSVDLSLWDLSSLQNNGGVPDLTTWKTVSTYADATGAGLSRGQTDANHFGYTLAATVEGAKFTTQAVNGSDVKLTITPTPSYTIWFAVATRINAQGNDSVAAAKQALSDATTQSYATLGGKSTDFWHSQWQRSFEQYSDASGEADYLENVYYLATYQILSGAFGNYPFHFVNGVFRPTGDSAATQPQVPWGYAYWFWNERDLYNSFPASNHVDALHGFNNLYVRNADTLRALTMSRYQTNAIFVPETMGWNGDASGLTQYTDKIYSTGTEAALNLYAEYTYGGDENFLKNTVYPFMRDAANFYVKMLSKDPGTGQYYMADSNAHETYWNVKNAITDLAAVRAMFPIAVQLSTKYALDADSRSAWQDILTNLAPYPTDGTSYLPHQPPISQMMNDENVACELIWPYGMTGIDAPDYQMAVSTWNTRPNPYQNIWSNDAVQAARLGLGDDTMAGMKTMLQRYQSYPNGGTNNTNGVFEFLGVNVIALNEALLQSYNDKIRVFPALPSDNAFVSRFTLLAKGGFLVSSEKEANDIKYVGIKSVLGNPIKVINPWGTSAVNVRQMSDNSVLSTSSAGEIDFNTTAGGIYVIERQSKPFASYTFSHVTGTANQDQKLMPDSSLSLGIASKTPAEMGKYEAENATLNACVASGDSSASGGSEVTNISPGSSVTFSNVLAGTSLDIRYCTMLNPGKLSLYVNGTKNQDITFPTTNSWSTTYATKTVSVTIPAGATLMLSNDPGDAGTNLDYIQVH